jgi:DNA replication protein DnaC
MELAKDLMGNILKGAEPVTGTCEKHGESTLMLPLFLKNRNWVCRTCNEEKAKADSEARWRAERTETLHRIAGIPYKYKGCRFEATTGAHKQVRSTVRAFRDAIASNRTWAVLVLFGGVGTGKTLLASELAQSLIDNLDMSVRYCTAKQMIAEIQSSYGQEGKSEEGEVLRFVQFDLLIIDEIDAKRDTDAANLLLTEIINRRYNEEKPVVVITNQPFDNLAKFVGDRVDDRLHENAYVCSFDWPSYRRGA